MTSEERPPILASDAERERSVVALREAVGEGWLTLEEFSERVERAQTARSSHVIRQGPWTLPARSSWRSIFGTNDLDLRQARLDETDTELRVHNVFGTGPCSSPRGSVAGGPRLTIHCSGPGGTLHVRSRPTLMDSLTRALKR